MHTFIRIMNIYVHVYTQILLSLSLSLSPARTYSCTLTNCVFLHALLKNILLCYSNKSVRTCMPKVPLECEGLSHHQATPVPV